MGRNQGKLVRGIKLYTQERRVQGERCRSISRRINERKSGRGGQEK